MVALCVAITFGVLTTGCSSTVQGAAVKAASSVPADGVPSLDESALDDLLLSNGELNKIAGVDLESFYTAEEMNDNADVVSDADCLGAIYPGENAVYDGTHWSAVRDELLLESGSGDDSRLVEQTLVLYGSRDDAVEFFDKSKDVWHECSQAKDITVDDGPWEPDDVQETSDRQITLKAKVSGSLSGTCSHSLGVVSNLIVEGFSCDAADHDDAETIATRILKNAADQ